MNTGRTNDTYVLWGAAPSLYTGKARSYLIKKGVPFRECWPTQPLYWSQIVPQLGMMALPVLEAPDGTLYQDTSTIIEHLEQTFPLPRLGPESPVQAAVAALIGAFGSEGLLRPAMHYRWSYIEQHRKFITAEFGRTISASRDRGEREAAAAPLMRAMNDYLPAFGIDAESVPAIEQSYEELLAILDEHFLRHPYVLGGRPSVADFGLMGPLFAHLARDPYPSTLMKRLAPNVFRWTERMNLPDALDGEFPDSSGDDLPDDALPDTLKPLLALTFRDWGPELQAIAAQFDQWVGAKQEPAAGMLVSDTGERRLHPSLGRISFELRGCTIRCHGMPQALWHFERASSLARTLAGAARERFDALIRETGGAALMAMRIARPIVRRDNVLVVG